MQTVSTNKNAESAAVVDANEVSGLVQLARRRIDEGFYNRPEVRRTVAALLLKDLARGPRKPGRDSTLDSGSSHPETA